MSAATTIDAVAVSHEYRMVRRWGGHGTLFLVQFPGHCGKPICDVWSHHRSATLCHLANIAMRLGRGLTWDLAAEDFVSGEQAGAMLC